MRSPIIVLSVLAILAGCRGKSTEPPAPTPESPEPSPSDTEMSEPEPEQPPPPAATVREMVDPVGYCTDADQMKAVMDSARELEAERLEESEAKLADLTPYAALCPHDDHLYAARVYLHAVPRVARADTVILFGVTHGSAREALGDPQHRIVLDDFESWTSALGPAHVDRALRERIEEGVEEDAVLVSREAHEKEHSIEGLVPWLLAENPDVRIVPIMVTATDLEHMDRITTSLADTIVAHARENDLVLGEDLAFLISVDAVHYGPDFDHSPFGTDEKAHEQAVARDRRIGETHLAGTITAASIEGFTEAVWDGKVTWCGRYSVPFGLMTTMKVASGLGGEPTVGVPLRYGDSHTLGTLPVQVEGLGTTAPESLEHWVGYWAIVYGA